MQPSGFPRQTRLSRAGEFSLLHKTGQRSKTRSFNIYVLPNGLGFSRLGVSVSSRAGSAVQRNKLKRLLREFFRLNFAFLGVPVDIHIVVKRGVKAATLTALSDVEVELSKFLKENNNIPVQKNTEK